ncbi:hypothetical protein EVAR_45978_1 [Eumeta japonica]|uniref:Uncharacterized protein n=1 Tax=Eumeta variegata TaxID=151549 RepID=A0A4C1YPL5_EUMVA|nr:hypothetical protein EVAR_45978_1 [Eumeta japonica]
MSIYYALAGWSGNRERRDERTKRKRGKEKVRSRSKIPISSKPAVRNFVPIMLKEESSGGLFSVPRPPSPSVNIPSIRYSIVTQKVGNALVTSPAMTTYSLVVRKLVSP